MPAVVVKTGPKTGRRMELDVEVAIGRQDGDLVLEDPEISRRHAVLRRSGASVIVEDLESTNGTFVNGERIRSPRAVHPGDQVRVGRTTLEIEPDPPAEDTIIPQADEQVDRTIVSVPLPPDQKPYAEAPQSRVPRTDFDEDATQLLPSRQPAADLGDATQPLPSRALEDGVRPTRSRKSWLLVGIGVVVAAVLLALIAYPPVVDHSTEKDFAASVNDFCATVQGSERGIDLSRSPTSGELLRTLNIRLRALGAMRALEPEEQNAELSRFLSNFADTNTSIKRLDGSIGSDKAKVARARGTLREDVKAERELASHAGIGVCGGLGID